MHSPDYLYSNAHAAALERLQELERIEDPDTVAALESLGNLTGWHCLEVGAGAGSIARWLAQRVGPMGCVDATDLDPRFLEPMASDTMEVWRQDVVRDALPAENFDLIHARHVLIHLGGGVAAALDNLCQSLKPAGMLLIEESDFAGARAADTTPESLQAVYDTGLAAMLNFFRHRGMDVHLGAAVPDLLKQRSMTIQKTLRRQRTVQGGSPEALFHRETYGQARDAVVSTGIASAAVMDEMIAAHADSRLFYQSRQTVCVTAQKKT